MNRLLIFLLILTSFSLFAKELSPLVIYGEDNRIDAYNVSNKKYKKVLNATAGLVDNFNLSLSQDEKTYSFNEVLTLKKALNVCKGERFASQPLVANCTGILIKDDILLTAGHCFFNLEQDICESASWVFDLKMKNAFEINLQSIKKENVYRCDKILFSEMNDRIDYAIVKLDRKVEGRTPVKLNLKRKLKNKTKLFTAGFPTMLPLKLTNDGQILKNNQKEYFEVNLDTFHGNSGSGVFNEKTGRLEGILISGNEDYVPFDEKDPSSCMVVNKCDKNAKNCLSENTSFYETTGERVMRLKVIKDELLKILN